MENFARYVPKIINGAKAIEVLGLNNAKTPPINQVAVIACVS
jgi:hypothetical protein